MATLAEIRAKLQAQDSRPKGGSQTGDNAIFAHWNIQEGSSATLRFLPDADEGNTFFWKERQMIRLSFPGVKGQDENKPVMVQVPCVEMWGEQCPVHAEIRPWFKDPALEDTARKYWKKRSYIFNGFVTDNESTEDNIPENPIRRFVISPQIYKIISAALMDPEFEEIPTDYEAGTDFKIMKSSKGGYADYSTSNWSRRSRGLDQTERDAIAANGLYNLNDFLPKKPDADHLNAIFEMFEASVNGELYDVDRFGTFYRPYGVDAPTGAAKVTPAPAAQVAAPVEAAPVAAPVAEAAPVTPPPVPAPAPAPAAASGTAPSAEDILAAIRNRK
jgi:hypothetical protein